MPRRGFEEGIPVSPGLRFNNNGSFGGGGFSLNSQQAQGIGSAAVSFASSIFAQGVAKEARKTNKLASEINQRREARSVRYQLGLARVSNAAAGNTQNGSFTFVNAQNEREGRERVEDERLRGVNRDIEIELGTPDKLSAGLNFATQVFGSFAGGKS